MTVAMTATHTSGVGPERGERGGRRQGPGRVGLQQRAQDQAGEPAVGPLPTLADHVLDRAEPQQARRRGRPASSARARRRWCRSARTSRRRRADGTKSRDGCTEGAAPNHPAVEMSWVGANRAAVIAPTTSAAAISTEATATRAPSLPAISDQRRGCIVSAERKRAPRELVAGAAGEGGQHQDRAEADEKITAAVAPPDAGAGPRGRGRRRVPAGDGLRRRQRQRRGDDGEHDRGQAGHDPQPAAVEQDPLGAERVGQVHDVPLGADRRRSVRERRRPG